MVKAKQPGESQGHSAKRAPYFYFEEKTGACRVCGLYKALGEYCRVRGT